MAKCPKCGNPRAKYVESRRKNWKGRAGDSNRSGVMESRKDFTVKCDKCGWTGELRPTTP